ncbi:MAG: hypothetical protein LLG01_02500 [Planctomycetaceae bacterium]|nr:hypothetical protein [Planctomycetaceae bacterium]
MKIRCTECQKRIAIDEAFAGGICRCPYCRALVPVPGMVDTTRTVARPSAPGARPAAPAGARSAAPAKPAGACGGGRVVQTAAGAIDESQIPEARRVMLQGVTALVMLGALVVLLGFGVWIVISIINPPPPIDPNHTPELRNPFLANRSRPAVADDIAITAPVVYIVDGAGSMSLDSALAYACRMTSASMKSLNGGQFSIVACQAKEDKAPPGGLIKANKGGLGNAEMFLVSIEPNGLTDLGRAMQKAMSFSPSTVVVLTRKGSETLKGMTEAIKLAKIRIVIVGICPTETDAKSMSDFAKSVGGQCRSFDRSTLATLFYEAQDALTPQ